MHSRPLGVALLATTLLLSGCHWRDDGGRDHDPANRPGYVLPGDRDREDRGRTGDHSVSGPANGLQEATFSLISSSDVVRIRAVDLGGDLYRVATPDDSRVAPSVQVDNGTVVAGLADTGLKGPALVTVELSRAVRWHIRLGGGAGEQTVDLTGGQPGDVDFSAGTTRAEVALPPAKGTNRVTMSGGAGQFLVHLAGDAPVQVRVGNGAGTVTVDGATRSGVGGNTVITAPGWASATDRYDVDASAGVSVLTVDRRP
jgi:hypothetical protein